MSKPPYVQQHEREQAYLNPPFMPSSERAKWEHEPGEYRRVEDALYCYFRDIEKKGRWPSHLDEDPSSLAQRFTQATWWGRATGDTGYYQAMCSRYGYLWGMK